MHGVACPGKIAAVEFTYRSATVAAVDLKLYGCRVIRKILPSGASRVKHGDLSVFLNINKRECVKLWNLFEIGCVEATSDVVFKIRKYSVESAARLTTDDKELFALGLDYKALVSEVGAVKLTVALAVGLADNELFFDGGFAVLDYLQGSARYFLDVYLKLLCRCSLGLSAISSVDYNVV